MKKVLFLASLMVTLGMATATMAQTKPAKDTTHHKPAHVKEPKKAKDSTTHKKH
jgi:hypothetical protein